jgi:hypothetical protein
MSRQLAPRWYVEDTFVDDNGVTLPEHRPDVDVLQGGWTDVIAGATIVANALDDNNNPRQAVIDSGQSDVFITSRMNLTGGGTAQMGLTFRYQDASNFLWAGQDKLWNLPVIYKYVAGVPTEIGGLPNQSLTIGDGETHIISVAVLGPQIRLWIDDVLWTSPVDAQFQNETIHGIWSDHVAKCIWYDFRVGKVLR